MIARTKETSLPEPEYIASYIYSEKDLQGLAQRNMLSVILGQRTFRFMHGFPTGSAKYPNPSMMPRKFDPYEEDEMARRDFKPFSRLSVGPQKEPPKILLVSQLAQGDPLFVARPYYPHWKLTSDFFDRAMKQQAATYEGNRLGRISYGKVVQLNGAAMNAEICGLLFTRFFEKTHGYFEGDAASVGHLSDWELASKFMDPVAEKNDYDKPEVFTYRSTFEPVYRSKRWEGIAREKDIADVTGGLSVETKGRLVEDLVGNALESLQGSVDNRHVRQVAGRLLRLHQYDPTHNLVFPDRVMYQLNQDPYYYLANQFLLAAEQAKKIIPDPDAPVYIPNYGRMDTSVMGNMLVPDNWIKKTFKRNQIDALGELVYAASLVRDDSNGRLRGVSFAPFILGVSGGQPQMISSFAQAHERALVHTALLIQAVNDWDRGRHGIDSRLSGISKIAIDKYGRLEKELARHPLLYDDPEDRRIQNDDRPGRGPNDDSVGSSPRGGQPRLGVFA